MAVSCAGARLSSSKPVLNAQERDLTKLVWLRLRIAKTLLQIIDRLLEAPPRKRCDQNCHRSEKSKPRCRLLRKGKMKPMTEFAHRHRHEVVIDVNTVADLPAVQERFCFKHITN